MPFYQGLRWSLCTWATRMSLMSPCRVGRAGLPLPLGPTPCARLRVQSPLHHSSSASPNCLAHQLPVEKRSCHSCRTDKSQQTATVFTMVGLEAAGVLNVLEDSWLAHAPRLVPLPFEWSILFLQYPKQNNVLPSIPCCSFMGRTLPDDKWHSTITTR